MSNTARPRIRLLVKDPNDKTDNRMASLSAILGPRGIKPMEVLQEFDKATMKKYEAGLEIIVHIDINVNTKGRAKSYKLVIGTPTLSSLVKKELGLTKLLKTGNLVVNSSFIDKAQELKKNSFPFIAADKVHKILVESLKSMNVAVKYEDTER